MKKKYLVLLIVIVTTMIPIGCSKGSSENVVLGTEKIIIDDNTKDKKSEDFQIKMVAETEAIDPGTIYWMLGVKENVIQLIYQYPSDIIREVRVGKLDSNNKVNWTSKNLDGKIYTDNSYYGLYSTKIKNDNKVYNVNKDGELEELAGYTKLIKEQGNVLDTHTSYRNGTIDVAYFGSKEEPKVAVIDIPNEKYYVIPNELIANDKDGGLRQILGIDGDKIYVNYEYTEGDKFDISKKSTAKNTIGYIENNKFTKILSEDDGIKIDTRGEMLCENGRILFSGLAEGKNGIWNYDIDNKKLTKIVDVDSETFFEFHINENKDKVVISSLKPALGKDAKQNNTLNIADINDKLEITNITNIVTNTEERHHKAFAGFANGGKTFYVRSTIADESYNATNKLEIYNIVE
ncbi:hypothetical protein H7E67_15220 [Clostridium gasigenes]|uniref:Uncharacterized protein n=1 Tax=Clostridium gasigenes TaxID=94869 RepID=A0A7X0SBX6_9CLOT|nr:hypothetical protein [Clostridium gasigenes]MBB6624791.1 hypothetical protein [Clostridium gasigenes]MBB6714838.1 hypothetical protein [Clostridium gasigenes]